MRLFIALNLSDDITNELAKLQDKLNGANWYKNQKLNLILRFVGDVDEDIYHELVKELQNIRFPAFYLKFKGLNYFAHNNIPHHLYIGVENDVVINELQEKINNAVIKAGGGNKDKFNFIPHIALAKLQGATVADIFTYISQHNLYESDEFQIESFSLFATHAHEFGQGKFYTTEKEFALFLV